MSIPSVVMSALAAQCGRIRPANPSFPVEIAKPARSRLLVAAQPARAPDYLLVRAEQRCWLHAPGALV